MKMKGGTSKEFMSSVASSILDDVTNYCMQNKINPSYQNFVPLIDDSIKTLLDLIFHQLNERFPREKINQSAKYEISNNSIISLKGNRVDEKIQDNTLHFPMYIYKEGDKCEPDFQSKEIRYIIPFKCKMYSSKLRVPLVRFGDRLLLSQPIADIKNLYLLCACVKKNGQIIGPILHKDQDLFRKNLKTHESGLVSYELRTEKEFRSERDKLSSFGPIIRTRNGLPFDRDSPAGTDPVFFWILEKHSDKVWGSTQMFVVGCKKSTFFKDHMSPSSEEMIKRRVIPFPLVSIDYNMFSTIPIQSDKENKSKNRKRSIVSYDNINVHNPNKIIKTNDSSNNVYQHDTYIHNEYTSHFDSNIIHSFDPNYFQPIGQNFIANQQFYPEIRDSFVNQDLLYGYSPFDDYMMAG